MCLSPVPRRSTLPGSTGLDAPKLALAMICGDYPVLGTVLSDFTSPDRFSAIFAVEVVPGRPSEVPLFSQSLDLPK